MPNSVSKNSVVRSNTNQQVKPGTVVRANPPALTQFDPIKRNPAGGRDTVVVRASKQPPSTKQPALPRRDYDAQR